jgi:AcrR family transcriptional regulator
MRRRSAPIIGRPRDPLTDDAILRAGMEVFIEQGIDGATIEQIARRAGVARTTVYRRWSSREDLLVEAIEHARRLPAQWGVGLKDVPRRELMRIGLTVCMDLLTQERFRKLAARLIGALPHHPSLMSAYQKHVLLPRRAAFRKVLERARAERMLPPDTDVSVVMDMLSGLMLYRLLLQPEERDPKKVRRYLLKVFRQIGLKSR